MYLSLKSIVKIGYQILVKLINLTFSVTFSLPLKNFTQVVDCIQIPDCNAESRALLKFFLVSHFNLSSVIFFVPLQESNDVFVSVSIYFAKSSKKSLTCFPRLIIPVFSSMVIVITTKMFHGVTY